MHNLPKTYTSRPAHAEEHVLHQGFGRQHVYGQAPRDRLARHSIWPRSKSIIIKCLFLLPAQSLLYVIMATLWKNFSPNNQANFPQFGPEDAFPLDWSARYNYGQNFVFFNRSATNWLETLKDRSGRFNKAKKNCMTEDEARLVGKNSGNPPIELLNLCQPCNQSPLRLESVLSPLLP